ncbi:MAG TPA: type I methionyl aminopeptidase [Acidimicrobiia bacterium]
MITIKSRDEFARMAVAGRCVAAAHEAIREAARPGVTTGELDEVSARVIAAHGCLPSFLGYGVPPFPGTICASPNDVIVHGIPGDYVLSDGDVLSIDVGAIYDGFHGDAAFTMAIGEVPREAQALIDVTEEAMWAGIAQVRHGARLGDIGAAVQQVGERAGYGVVREYVGHGIGRAMHEEPQIPNYGVSGRGMKLRRGMAVCIEPMFNMGSHATKVDPDHWTVRTEDGTVSAHWEHTVCITPDGVVVTTVGEGATIPVSLA